MSGRIGADPLLRRFAQRKNLRQFLGLLAGLLLFASPVLAAQITGLQNPQNFLADPNSEYYYISNANGDPETKDNNGFITKLDHDGKVVNPRFIQGGDGATVLHAPKGMAIVNNLLYVADLDAVRVFDLSTGKPRTAVSVAGLHDAQTAASPGLSDLVCATAGILYATDTAANTIYRIDLAHDHAVHVLVRDAGLAGPRGIAIHPKTGHLIVGSWHKGKIFDVALDGTMTELVSNGFFSSRFHNLDGLDFDSWGNLYISDFTAGKIWRMRPDQKFDVIAEYLPTPAGIGIDRNKNLILVPYHYANAAEINGLETPSMPGSRPKRSLADYGFNPLSPPKEGAPR
jgi:hypothetical protein